MLAFFFACYGGGTPKHDDFPKPGTTTLNQVAPDPFMARLPMRMLGREKGGALAVIAHVERAWGASFIWARNMEQTDIFKSTLTHLMGGKPVGSALEYFNSRYATWASELSTILRDVQFGLQVEPVNISSMWTAHNDALGYAIIGDPAARLALAQEGSGAQERPLLVVQPVDCTSASDPSITPATPTTSDRASTAPTDNADVERDFSGGTTQVKTRKEKGMATAAAEAATTPDRILFAQTLVTPNHAIENVSST